MTDLANQLETDSSIYKTLLESTKAIPWRIDWKTMQFTYIGPQIEPLLGWTPDSWKTVDDWATRMHPEDRDYVVNFCVSQSQAGTDHEADYRALTADGDYVWIRDVVHVVRKDGEVEALIGFMFDISERKQTEEKLLALQKELEELSFKDGLTGVANRRMFDSIIEVEWTNARRNHQPLSLVLLDIDYFKQYND
ncbi:MAG: PAS domain-containing protein, partial [Pseudomonas sp.]